MFKKKHSQIQSQRNYSPFRIASNQPQLPRTPDRSNLSPMKNHTQANQFKTKSPRKQFAPEPYSAGKLVTQVRKFQAQLGNLGNEIELEERGWADQSCYRGRYVGQAEEASYGSFVNYQATDRAMKQSKKIFSNALSKMNSDKKKNGISNQNSIFQESKHQIEATSVIAVDHLPIASFKALKQIKMIESVNPLAPPPLLQRSLNKKQSSGLQKGNRQGASRTFRGLGEQNSSVEQFAGEQKGRKQKIVELINQSFSVSPVIADRTFEGIELAKQKVLLGKEKKIMESLYIDQSLQFKALNTIISKIDGGGNPQQQLDSEPISVKGSIQSAKCSLTMDPFL